MKKNNVLRASLVVLVLTLMTYCLVSGTFAKYTSTAAGSESARVAKFEFDLGSATQASEAVNMDLFNTAYATDKVVSANTDKVIAPGTKGEMVLSIQNKSEVAIVVDAFTFVVASTTDNATSLLEKIVWTVNGEECAKDALGSTIKGKLNGVNAYLTPNAAAAQNTVTIGWTWAANGDNTTDTTLGLAGTDKITVTLNAIVSQYVEGAPYLG